MVPNLNYQLNNIGRKKVVGDKNIEPLSRFINGFFVLSVEVVVPSEGQQLLPIAVMDKNMS
ncbi:hypothetical protein [Paenibacillus ottowii]|uniref:Uncharacterized protein n=1 Tax=Paenibacillus ottowii TaxID=2315729 RepID=A0ABY3AXD7_9BACL|nr:hypothetical protein [Paenibacillus ottowii]TQR92827.1 hypothetical protein FKV70_25145 [Paenibacillus ottowii]